MKRDLDLIRDILARVEAMQGPGNFKIDGRSDAEVCYNVQLAAENGLLIAKFPPGYSDTFMIIRLTFDGHEFLDASRSETVWASAKEKMAGSAGTITMEGLKLLLKVGISHALGHPI
jgi:hypothetical protein